MWWFSKKVFFLQISHFLTFVMKILLTSCNYDNYNTLSNLTWPNKIEYCKRHNYLYFHKNKDFVGNIVMGFEKIYYILNLLQTSDEFDWLWFVGCDTLIMNFEIKIENIINGVSEDKFFIIAKDIHGLNADSFLIKNSKSGLDFLYFTWDKMKEYNNKWPYEQGVWWDYYEDYKHGIELIPQYLINSYDYSLYGMNYEPGQYRDESLLIHWPGLDLNKRIELYHKYVKIIKT